MEYVIHIKGRVVSALLTTLPEKSELDRLVKKYLAMKGLTVGKKRMLA